MKTFCEKTNDNGIARKYCASDNNAVYVITSAYGHDLLTEYDRRFDGRLPSARWFNRHFDFEEVR